MFLDSFLNYLKYERNYSKYTIASYSNDLSQFEEFVGSEIGGDYFPIKVDADIVRNWIVYLLDEKVSPVTVNRKLSSLKSFFKFLVRQQVISANPIRLVRGPKVGKPLPDFVKERDMVFLLDGDTFNDDFKGLRDRLILEMLYDTGMRRSELIGLKDSDVYIDQSLLRVTGKGNKQRLIPFADRLKDLMLAYLKQRRVEVDFDVEYLFVRENGEQLSGGIVYNVVRKSLSSVSTITNKNRGPHVLRHSFATAMLNNGAELNAVKELLGHSSLVSTSVYTHTTFRELKKVYYAHPRAVKKEVIMDVRIQAIHFVASEQLEAFVQKKVAKLDQYYDGILLAEVILKVVKPEAAQNKNASVKLKIKSSELFAEKTADTFEEAIDVCTEALSKQLIKHKDKINNGKKNV